VTTNPKGYDKRYYRTLRAKLLDMMAGKEDHGRYVHACTLCHREEGSFYAKGNKKVRLEFHHLVYINEGVTPSVKDGHAVQRLIEARDFPQRFRVLCRSCHMLYHGSGRGPPGFESSGMRRKILETWKLETKYHNHVADTLKANPDMVSLNGPRGWVGIGQLGKPYWQQWESLESAKSEFEAHYLGWRARKGLDQEETEEEDPEDEAMNRIYKALGQR